MGNHRPHLRNSTKEMINQNASFTQTNNNGQIADPNTGEILNGKVHQYGHVTGMENRGFLRYSNQAGMKQSELNDICNNAGLYQLESPHGNMNHQSEEPNTNVTALNTANYSYLKNPQYQESTFINPPDSENGSWSVTTINRQTGDESLVGTFSPDLGEVTSESRAAMESAVGISDNQMSDFGSDGLSDSGESLTTGNADTFSDINASFCSMTE